MRRCPRPLHRPSTPHELFTSTSIPKIVDFDPGLCTLLPSRPDTEGRFASHEDAGRDAGVPGPRAGDAARLEVQAVKAPPVPACQPHATGAKPMPRARTDGQFKISDEAPQRWRSVKLEAQAKRARLKGKSIGGGEEEI